MPHEITIK